MDFKGLALTPPMGWNSWDCMGAGATETELLETAQFIAENLKDYGWEYLVCDIQWYEPQAVSHAYNNFSDLCMDEFSRLIPAENRFPSAAGGRGFKPIADRVHALGLKFGIHIMRGIPRQAVHRNTLTVTGISAREIASRFSLCPWNTDMYGVDANKKGAQEYYNSLFEMYAAWGVDYVKCDDISNTEFKPHEPYSAAAEIEMLRKAIDSCGRNIVLSLSPGPAPLANASHLAAHANLWRMTGDFWDEWSKLKAMFERCEQWQPFVAPGTWPDCDMLPLGRLCVHENGGRNTKFTHDEQITMMTLWTIFRSPLMLGCDLRSCDEFTLSLLQNREVIKMFKSLTSSRQLFRNEEKAVWLGNSKEHKYIALFNLSEKELEVSAETDFDSIEYTELWSGEIYNTPCATIRPHAAKLLKQNMQYA